MLFFFISLVSKGRPVVLIFARCFKKKQASIKSLLKMPFNWQCSRVEVKCELVLYHLILNYNLSFVGVVYSVCCTLLFFSNSMIRFLTKKKTPEDCQRVLFLLFFTFFDFFWLLTLTKGPKIELYHIQPHWLFLKWDLFTH